MKKSYYELKTVSYSGKNYRLFDLPYFGQIIKIFFTKESYRTDSTLAVCVMCIDNDKYEQGFPVEQCLEPFSTATVNLVNPRQNGQIAFADTNNNDWLEKFVKKNGLAETTGITASSGFCTYPLLKWNTDKFLA